MSKMRQNFPEASHIMAAYSIKNGDGYEDDREFGASSRILNILKDNSVSNVAIFVVRYFDGKHIGPKRHELIKKVTTELLVSMKLLQQPT